MVFHLFKNVYLDLASAFQFHHPNEYDCILLTEQFDHILPPEHTRLVYKYTDLDSLVADRFGGYVEEFFKALFSYTNTTGKPLVIFCQDQDFTRLVLQYYRDVYPKISDRTLLSLYDKALDRLFLLSTSFGDGSEKTKAAYRGFGRDSDAIQLQIQNTQHKLDYSPEMKQWLPFESLYVDFLITRERSAYLPALLEHVKDFAVFELRSLVLTIYDGILSMAYDMKTHFPEVRPFYRLSDTFKDLRFSLLFDEKGVRTNNRSWGKDTDDLQHIFKSYAPEYIEYLFKKCDELANASPLLPRNSETFITCWRLYSRAVQDDDYLSLLTHPEIKVPNIMAVCHACRSKYNWLMIRHVEGILGRNDNEAQNFKL